MNPPQDLPIQVTLQIYYKALELQDLCKQIQHPDTIIYEAYNTTFILNMKTLYMLPTTCNNDLLTKIKMNLLNTTPNQIFSVTVPMTINTSQENCYTKIIKKYWLIACPSNYNQIHCLAYGYHLGALLLEKPDHDKSIKASRIKA